MRRPTAKECKLQQEKTWEMNEKIKKMSRRDPKYKEKVDEMLAQGKEFGKRVAVYWRREGKFKGKLKGIDAD